MDNAMISEMKTLKQMEVFLIIDALRRNKGNREATARSLGINKSTLFRKLKTYNIKPETYI
jgi:DNA-binding NtrC family response regulator